MCGQGKEVNTLEMMTPDTCTVLTPEHRVITDPKFSRCVRTSDLVDYIARMGTNIIQRCKKNHCLRNSILPNIKAIANLSREGGCVEHGHF